MSMKDFRKIIMKKSIDFEMKTERRPEYLILGRNAYYVLLGLFTKKHPIDLWLDKVYWFMRFKIAVFRGDFEDSEDLINMK